MAKQPQPLDLFMQQYLRGLSDDVGQAQRDLEDPEAAAEREAAQAGYQDEFSRLEGLRDDQRSVNQGRDLGEHLQDMGKA